MSVYKGIYLVLFVCIVIIDIAMPCICILFFFDKNYIQGFFLLIMTFAFIPGTIQIWKGYKSYDDDNKAI